ncbi:hypothetical protein K7432_014853 [Basidiobolus ranarum]|uniref:Myb-like domain-containing protein n=1 Tax=Basidiobolus ranarum TaxID=34480 RepID=A0ABR2VPY4_9FUNG
MMTTIGRSWETAETKLLIELRRVMETEFASMKRNAPLWKKISDQMKTGGYHRTDKQCKEKWKNLLSEFKRAETQKDIEPRNFPFYDILKDVVSKQSSLPDSPIQSREESINASYPPSPTPASKVINDHGPVMPATQHVNLPPPVGYSPGMSVYSPPLAHSISHSSQHSNNLHMPTPIFKPIAREPVASNFGTATSSNKRRRDSEEDESPPSVLLTEIVDLLRREIQERRRWEDRLEQSRFENERRRERQERRRERRERERVERQRAQTLLLVAIASRIMPNVADLITAANFHDVASSDSERSGAASGSN